MVRTGIEKIVKGVYHKIPLSDQKKQKLKNLISRKSKRDEPTREQFLKKLLKYKIISFDIFDTLITRTIYEPDDLFVLMDSEASKIMKLSKPFIEMRKEAEAYANLELHKDPNLKDIYNAFSKIFNIDRDVALKFEQMEMDMEIKICVPRYDMLYVFNELKARGKKIILVSDMYLPKDTIEKMLLKCGYHGYYKFYLSNVLNVRKDTSTMWRFLINTFNKKHIIHIGDNINSDYLIPKKYGVAAINIKRGKDLFLESDYGKFIDTFNCDHSINVSFCLGNIVNKELFNSPFAKQKIDNFEDFGYAYLGPIILEFMEYLKNNISKKEKLLFLAREGYYFQKIYNKYCNINKLSENNSIYFLTSRRSTSIASIRNESDVLKICENIFDGKISNFFNNILGVPYIEDDFEISLPRDSKKVTKIVKKQMKLILDNANYERENYLKYINETVGDFKSAVLVDLGYSGTIQYNLSSLLKTDLKGYYVTNSEKVKQYSNNSELNFCFDRNKLEVLSKMYSYSLLIEYFLTAPYGQFMHFDKIGTELKPIYNDEIVSEERINISEKIYAGIIKYISDMLPFYNDYTIKVGHEFIMHNFNSCIETASLDPSFKNKFIYMDSYNCDTEYNIFTKLGH